MRDEPIGHDAAPHLPTLHAASLRMPPLGARHRALYVDLYTDARVMARIGAALDAAAASRAFDAALACHRVAMPRHRTWAVEARSDGQPLGIAALATRTHDTEMGLMLHPAAWNGRYSHEVIDVLVAHAFDDLRLDRLTGICRVGPNERMSRRLLQAHGFVDAPPDRPGTARWTLERPGWRRPVGTAPGAR